MSEPPAPRKASEYAPRALNPFLQSQSNPRGDRRRAVVIVPNRDGAGLEMVSPRASEPVTPRSATAGASSLAVPNGRASRSGSLTRNRSDSFAAAMKNLLATASPLSDVRRVCTMYPRILRDTAAVSSGWERGGFRTCSWCAVPTLAFGFPE